MNKFLALLSFAIVISCSSNDDVIQPGLIGQWKLVKIWVSPGDGSGMQSVSSSKILEFHPDGTFTSNGSLCGVSVSTDNPSSGTFSLSDSTIKPSQCLGSPDKIRFHRNGNTLTISYPSIEPCNEIYSKID